MKSAKLGLLALAILAGCNKNQSNASSDGDQSPLTRARAGIVAHNYGEAAKAAHDAITAAPHDPRAQLELARAEALQGNEGNALSALEQAVTDGLASPGTALADPAFDQIRDTPRFVALQSRALPGAGAGPEQSPQAGAGNDGVSISGEPGHEVIRAGDVSIGN
jgi:hypothetical protein